MKNFVYVVKIALPLLLICVITVAALAAVNSFTAPVIAANEEKELNDNMRFFYGDGISAQTIDAPEGAASVKAVYKVTKDGQTAGYCFDVTGKGAYKGTIEVLVALDADGTVNNIANVKNNETPSIGGKVLQSAYFERYSGVRNAEQAKAVEFLSGATRTSTALNDAVLKALDAYAALQERQVSGQ